MYNNFILYFTPTIISSIIGACTDTTITVLTNLSISIGIIIGLII